MEGDEGGVPHVSATRRKKCPIRVNGLHEKKKKISFHALKDSFIRHSRIKACTGVATRPHAIAAHISIISLIDGSVHTSDRQIISYVITVTAKLIKFHVTHNVT